jgi:hypothetical protein
VFQQIDAGYLHPTLREEGIFYDANMIAQIAKDCCVADEELHTPKRIANKSFCCNSAISLLSFLTNFAPFLCFSK